MNKSLIDQEKEEAIKYLQKIDEEYDVETIVDSTWYDYFWEDVETLEALKIITGCRNYREIFNAYEGLKISELIKVCK